MSSDIQMSLIPINNANRCTINISHCTVTAAAHGSIWTEFRINIISIHFYSHCRSAKKIIICTAQKIKTVNLMQQLLLGIQKHWCRPTALGLSTVYITLLVCFHFPDRLPVSVLVVGIFQWLFLQIASIHQSGDKWLALNHSLTRIRNEVTVLIRESFESFTQQIHSGMKQVTALILSHLNYSLNNIVKNH